MPPAPMNPRPCDLCGEPLGRSPGHVHLRCARLESYHAAEWDAAFPDLPLTDAELVALAARPELSAETE